MDNCVKAAGILVGFLSDQVLLGVIVAVVTGAILLPAGLIWGLFLENSKDIIKGKDHHIVGVSGKYFAALDCVHSAEQQLPEGLGEERFQLALRLYQGKMGRNSLKEDGLVVQMMFDKSSLKH